MQNSRNPLFALLLIISLSRFNYFIIPIAGNPELRALIEIKSSLDPINKHFTSWMADGNHCDGTFEGVACNVHGKVANISLQGKGLTGKLPTAVAELKCLSGLYLHYNSLTGEIPKEIANLTELTDLYLNFNSLSGSIPSEIGSMANLQVLQLSYNQLRGNIPKEMGFLKKLDVLALENNRLTGQIPASLGNLRLLKRLYLSSNQLYGSIPHTLVTNPSLEVLHVQNNALSGVIPPVLKRLNKDFQFDNNLGLCGTGFSTLRACTPFDNLNLNINSSTPLSNRSGPTNIPRSATFPLSCNQPNCSKSPFKLPQIGIVAGVITLVIMLTVAVFTGIVKYRHQKREVGNKSDISHDDRLSIDYTKDFMYKRNPALVALEYSKGWDPTKGTLDCKGLCNFTLEEVESATQHFSDVNLLGKSKFSAVYKGILKDGSTAAIKSIKKTSCKTEEDEFLKGLSLLNSLKHENLVELKGFCRSKGRGKCFLIYDFAPKGNLSKYLDAEEDSGNALDWPTRVSIIRGIAKEIRKLDVKRLKRPPLHFVQSSYFCYFSERFIYSQAKHLGNYYLADSGYTNGPGFLTPYRGVRYHLKERDHGSDAPCNYKELYNLRHAKARNVIDRSFDLLKIRWTVLHNYSFYNIFIQNKTIMACCLLQNFFRCDMIVDPLENADLGQEDNVVGTQSFLYEFVDQVEHTQECTNCRETLAVNMYNEWLSSR